MAKKVQDRPVDTYPAAAGVTFSSVSSLVQTGIVLLFLSPSMFALSAPILIVPTAVALLYGTALARFGSRDGPREREGLDLPEDGAVGAAGKRHDDDQRREQSNEGAAAPVMRSLISRYERRGWLPAPERILSARYGHGGWDDGIRH